MLDGNIKRGPAPNLPLKTVLSSLFISFWLPPERLMKDILSLAALFGESPEGGSFEIRFEIEGLSAISKSDRRFDSPRTILRCVGNLSGDVGFQAGIEVFSEPYAKTLGRLI